MLFPHETARNFWAFVDIAVVRVLIALALVAACWRYRAEIADAARYVVTQGPWS